MRVRDPLPQPATEPGGLRERATAHARAALASTRFRLAAALVLLFAVAALIMVLVVRTVLLAQLDDSVKGSLAQEYEEYEEFLRMGVDPGNDNEPVINDIRRAGELFLDRSVLDPGEALFILKDGRPPLVSGDAPYDLTADPAIVARWSALDDDSLTRQETPAGPVEVLAVPVLRGPEGAQARTGTFVIANFTAGARGRIDDVLVVLAQVSAGALAVIGLLAWSIAGRVLRPLTEMTQTARRITQESLDGRLRETGGNDEVATLVRTFNGMMDRLEGLIGSQRAFLADAGHDLRTPLTIMRGNLEQLRAGMVPEDDVDETLELLGDEVQRMSRLVEDLMLLARTEQPDFLRTGPVDLGDLAVAILRRAEAMPGPAWRAQPGVGVVEADGERLTQAALNLVTNAARYSPPGQPVTIGTRLANGTAELWVADSGPGVALEKRATIFDRFVRGPERRRTGTGLGLAIARAIAEAHGGELIVDDAVEGGARFRLSFPDRGPVDTGDRITRARSQDFDRHAISAARAGAAPSGRSEEAR